MITKTRSAAKIGGARGGCGGGYEQTNPDYVENRTRQLVQDYFKLEPRWRETFLDSMHAKDRQTVLAAVRERAQQARSAMAARRARS